MPMPNRISVTCMSKAKAAQDYSAAMSWYQRAADGRSVEAQLHLGKLYADGRGVPQNYTTAASWFSAAAESGNPDAQRLLGEMYAKGQGVPRNLVIAYQRLNLAAANGAEGAAELRDELAAKMTSAQIAEAQNFAGGRTPRK